MHGINRGINVLFRGRLLLDRLSENGHVLVGNQAEATKCQQEHHTEDDDDPAGKSQMMPKGRSHRKSSPSSSGVVAETSMHSCARVSLPS